MVEQPGTAIVIKSRETPIQQAEQELKAFMSLYQHPEPAKMYAALGGIPRAQAEDEIRKWSGIADSPEIQERFLKERAQEITNERSAYRGSRSRESTSWVQESLHGKGDKKNGHAR